jgi:hypothetical protein
MADDRRPYIKFETVPVEDRAASAATGVYMTRDEDFIVIIPHGSEGKTELREKYTDWLAKIKQQLGPVRAGGSMGDTPFIMESRFPREWLDAIEKGYTAWKKGEELPVEGTPLKQWAVLPPAMLQNLLANHIYTIEQLANASDEAINPVGMGARMFRNQALEWVKLNKEDERNKISAEVTALRTQNATLVAQVGELMAQMQDMLKRMPMDPTTVMQQHVKQASTRQ